MPERPRVYVALAALLLNLPLLGCGPAYGEAFVTSFNAAKRAHAAGRYAEAAELYAQASRDARRIKDRDEAHFMQARMYERLERYAEAQDVYRGIARQSPKGPRGGRAAFDAATIEIEHGDAERGFDALREAMLRYPSHGSARRALALWAAHVSETRGEEALRLELAQLQPRLIGSDIAQQVDVETAQSFRRSGDLAEAHRRLIAAARKYPYPHGTLTDDAYFHAAEVAVELGDPRLAIADLEALLATREVAVGGSYERPRYPAAQLRIGEIYRDLLHDPDKAREAFRRTYEQHATSILADDALFDEAVLTHQAGDTDGACALSDKLTERYPDSRYRLCLRAICSSAPVGERACPDYIRARVEGRDDADRDAGGASGGS